MPPDAKKRILDEATRLFATQGFGSTSVRELVSAAGVTKPVLYYHFGNKEGLFLETVQTNLAAFSHAIEDSVAADGTVVERIGRFVDAFVQRVSEHRFAIQLLVTAQYAPEEGKPAVDLMSVHRRHGELLASLLQEGVDAGELRASIDVGAATMSLLGALNLMAMAICHDMPLDPNHRAHLFELFFRGVAPCPE